jgi:hypothetical protein
VLLVEKELVRPAEVVVPAAGAGLRQLLEERLVDRARGSVGQEDLVGARKCRLEYEAAHKTGIILTSWGYTPTVTRDDQEFS